VDIHPITARFFQEVQRLPLFRPVRSVLGLQVRDLQPRPGIPRDPYRLTDCFQERVGLVPHMRRVDPVRFRRGGDDLRELRARGEAPRRVLKPGRDPARPLLDCPADFASHPLHLIRTRAAIIQSDDHLPDGPETDVGHQILRGPLPLQQRKVSVHVPVGTLEPGLLPELLQSLAELGSSERSGRRAVHAGRLGGHPLAHFALRARIADESRIDMTVYVGETRTHGRPRRVDNARGRRARGNLSQRRDPAVADPHGSRSGRPARSIQQRAPPDDQVECRP